MRKIACLCCCCQKCLSKYNFIYYTFNQRVIIIVISPVYSNSLGRRDLALSVNPSHFTILSENITLFEIKFEQNVKLQLTSSEVIKYGI